MNNKSSNDDEKTERLIGGKKIPTKDGSFNEGAQYFPDSGKSIKRDKGKQTQVLDTIKPPGSDPDEN